MKKKTWIVALILVAMVATMAIGLAACGTNLDGTYKDKKSDYILKISGNTILSMAIIEKKEMFKTETTFTIEKDKLVLADKNFPCSDITISKDKTSITCKFGSIPIATYVKV